MPHTPTHTEENQQQDRVDNAAGQARSNIQNLVSRASNLLKQPEVKSTLGADVLNQTQNTLQLIADTAPEPDEETRQKMEKQTQPGTITAGQDTAMPDEPPETDAERQTDSTISSLVSSTAGIEEEDLTPEQEEFLENKIQSLETAEGKKEGFMQRLKGFMTGDDRASVFEEEFQDRGGNEAFKKVQGLRPEVAKLRGKVDELDRQQRQAIANLEERARTSGLTSTDLEAEKQRIRREFRREKADLSASLGAKASLLQAWQGNLSSARNLAQDAAQAFSADRQFKSGILSSLINEQSDWVNSLDEDVQGFLVDLRDFNQQEARNKKDRFNTVMNLYTQAASNGVDLGWTDRKIKELASSRDGVATAVETYSTEVADIAAQTETKDTRTQTERAIDTSVNRLNQATPEGGTVSLSEYLSIRATEALTPSNFDDRFASTYLSEEDQEGLSKIKDEFGGITTSDLIGS